MATREDAKSKNEATEIMALFCSLNKMNDAIHVKRKDALVAHLMDLGAIDELSNMQEYLPIRFIAKRGKGEVKKKALRKLEQLMDIFMASNDLKTLSSIAKNGRMRFAYKALEYMYTAKAENFLIENVIRCCYFMNRPRMGFRALTLLESMLDYLITTKNIPAISFIALFGKKKREEAIVALSHIHELNIVKYVSNAHTTMADFSMQTQKGRLSFMAHLFAVIIKERMSNEVAESSNVVVGLEENTIPLIELISKELNLQSTIVRNTDPEAKQWHLVSDLPNKKPKDLIIVDDVLTTGTALKAVVLAMQKTDYHIRNIVVFVNLCGMKKIQGVPIHSILD